MSDVSIARLKRIMRDCSMPLELTMKEFREQFKYKAPYKVPDKILLSLCSSRRTYVSAKDDFLCDIDEYIHNCTKFFVENDGLKSLKELVKGLLNRFGKPSWSIDDIADFSDMKFLLEHGLVFISEEERRQKEAQKNSQLIDGLFNALDDIIASSQKELDELEEARANMLEDIEQKRNQILQRMEALRSRVAKLGANQENIQPKKDERIREME